MSSPRRLNIAYIAVASILNGCTFKLNLASSYFYYDESVRKFLNNQVTFYDSFESSSFEEIKLPNLTQFVAFSSWKEVIVLVPSPLMFSTFSTAPIQKLSAYNLNHIWYPYFSLLFIGDGHLRNLDTSIIFVHLIS